MKTTVRLWKTHLVLDKTWSSYWNFETLIKTSTYQFEHRNPSTAKSRKSIHRSSQYLKCPNRIRNLSWVVLCAVLYGQWCFLVSVLSSHWYWSPQLRLCRSLAAPTLSSLSLLSLLCFAKMIPSGHTGWCRGMISGARDQARASFF